MLNNNTCSHNTPSDRQKNFTLFSAVHRGKKRRLCRTVVSSPNTHTGWIMDGLVEEEGEEEEAIILGEAHRCSSILLIHSHTYNYMYTLGPCIKVHPAWPGLSERNEKLLCRPALPLSLDSAEKGWEERGCVCQCVCVGVRHWLNDRSNWHGEKSLSVWLR